jgi:hypothetical protein
MPKAQPFTKSFQDLALSRFRGSAEQSTEDTDTHARTHHVRGQDTAHQNDRSSVTCDEVFVPHSRPSSERTLRPASSDCPSTFVCTPTMTSEMDGPTRDDVV